MKRFTAILLLCFLACPAYGVTVTGPVESPPAPPIAAKPSIDIDDLSTANTIIYRGRQASLYAPEDELCVWRDTFATGNEYSIFSTSGPTLTRGDGKGVYSSTSGTTSASLLATVHLRHAQYTSRVRIDAMNASPGASFNDVFIGLGKTTTATSDTLQYQMGAYYRRTESINRLILNYTYSGGSGTPVTVDIADAPPFYLIHIQNHNAQAVAIEKLDGSWRILANQEIPLARHDLESQTDVAKLRPMLYWQSDGAQSCTVKNWSVSCLGSLGEREHMVARYQDGRPITDKSGKYVYVTCDDTHANAASDASPSPNSAFMRNHHCAHLYDPATGRFVQTTACFAMKMNGRVFGCQEGFVLYDEGTGKWHFYCADWNSTGIDGADGVKLYHASSYDNYLEAGDKVFEESELTRVNLSSLTGFDQESLYSFNVWKHNGLWYGTGVKTTDGNVGLRRVYLVHATNPEFTSPVLDWIDTEDTTEGGYFWHVGDNDYVSCGAPGNSVKVLDLSDNEVASFIFPGGNHYEQFMDLLPWVKGGKTQYQAIGFASTSQGVVPDHGEEFKLADGTYEPLTFGTRLVIDMGTFDGKQWTAAAKAEGVK